MKIIKITSIIYLTLFSSMFFIFMTGLNSIHWNDDFNYLRSISNMGFFKEALNQYNTWDGRVISPLFLIRNIILYYFPPQILSILALFSLFITSYFLYKLLVGVKAISISKSSYIIVSVLGILLWISYKAHMARSIYWATGSYYQFANMLLILWMYYYIYNKRNNIYFLFLTFTVLSLGTNVAMVVFTFVFLLHMFNIRIINFKRDLLCFSVGLLAFALSTFAPGNFIRASTSLKKGIDLDISNFIYNYWMVFKEYLLMSKSLMLFSIVFGIMIYSISIFNSSKKNVFIIAIIFLVSGLSSITPFVIVPDAASKHTSIHFQTCLFIFIFLIVNILLQTTKIVFPKPTFNILLNIISIYIGLVALQQYIIGRDVRSQIQSRYDYLETKKGIKDTIYLEKLNQPENFFTTNIWDIKNPPDDSNRILQREYNTGPILPE